MDTAEIRRDTKNFIKGKHLKASFIFLIYSLLVGIIGIIPFIGSTFIMIMSIPLGYGIISCMIKLKRDEEVGYFDFISIGFSQFSNAWRVAFSMLGKVWPYLVGYFISAIFLIIGVVTSAFSIALLTVYDSPLPDMSSLGTFSLIFMGIGIIGFIVFAILLTLKCLYYSLSNYILYDNTSMKGKEIVEKSYSLMKGHRWDLVKMQIPYYLIAYLITFALGIVMAIVGISPDENSFMFSLLSIIPMLYFFPLIQFSILKFYDKLNELNGNAE